MNVGGFGSVGAARVDHHDRDAAGVAFFAFDQALKQHRMAFRCVGADQHRHAAVVEVVVAGRRAIGAEAAGVASHRRAHAEPGIGIEVVGAEGSFEQLLGEVVVLRVELARAIHGNGISPFVGQGGLDLIGDGLECLLPAHRFKVLIEAGAIQRLVQSSAGQGFAHSGPFDADLALAGGVAAIAARRPHRVAVVVFFDRLARLGRRKQFESAAHTAIRALAAPAWGGGGHRDSERKNPGHWSRVKTTHLCGSNESR